MVDKSSYFFLTNLLFIICLLNQSTFVCLSGFKSTFRDTVMFNLVAYISCSIKPIRFRGMSAFVLYLQNL